MCAKLLQSCLTLCNPMNYTSLTGSSSHGILQARIMEWVAIPFSRGSSRARDWTHISYISCIGGWVLYHCTTWEALATSQALWMLPCKAKGFSDVINNLDGTSLVIQGLRLWAPNAGSQLPSLVRELDPTCHNWDLVQPIHWFVN